MKRLSIFAGLLVAALLASGVPAGANAPRQVTREDNFTLTLRCDGFRLIDEVQALIHIQRFYGSDDRIRRIAVHIQWDGVITNKATGEFITPDPGHWTDTFTRDTVTTRGMQTNIRIPELGVVIMGVGRVVADLKTGKVLFQSSTDEHHENLDTLCEALA